MPELASSPLEAGPPTTLKRDSVRFLGAVGTSIGIAAPAGGVTFLPALMAGIVGGAGPFTFAVTIVAMLLISSAFVVFTRHLSSAGSIYAFNGTAMGSSYGFVSAWLLLFVYVAFAASVYASNANGVVNLVHPASLEGKLWIPMAVGMWALTIAFTYRSITLSTLFTFVLEGVALVMVGILAVVVIAKGGYHGHAGLAHPFNPHGLALGTIGLGVVFAFTGFSGFEVSATLGEESRRATRIIPWAMVSSILVSGGIYTFISWVEAIAYPSAQALAKSALTGVPLVTTANQYISRPFGTVINIAALVSGFGAQLACVNGATRLLFALGRDGFGPRQLGHVHPRHRSPRNALAVVAVLTLVPALALYFRPALLAFQDLATYGADLIIVAYLMTMVAALVWLGRQRRITPMLIVLVAGLVTIGYVLYKTVHPLPAAPFSYYLLAAAVTIAAGVLVIVAVPGLRRRLAGSPLFAVAPGGPKAPAP